MRKIALVWLGALCTACGIDGIGNMHKTPLPLPTDHINAGRLGDRAFDRKDYASAVRWYEMLLDDVQNNRQRLSHTSMVFLVENLGMSYGMTGLLDKAQAMFKYGIDRVDATYPLFYYGLACVYAEKGQLEVALPYLEETKRNRAHNLPGRAWPSLREDESFRKYRSDPAFLKAIESFEAGDREFI